MDTEQIEAAVDAAVKTLEFQLGAETRFKLVVTLPNHNTKITIRHPAPLDADLARPIDILCDTGAIEKRVIAHLKRVGFYILGDIARQTEAGILSHANTGSQTRECLKRALEHFNLDIGYSAPVGQLEMEAVLKLSLLDPYIDGVTCNLPQGTLNLKDLIAMSLDAFLRTNPTVPEDVVTGEYNMVRTRLQKRGLLE